LGSIIALTNNSGTKVETYTYDSFGKIVSSGSVVQSFTYTGREYDNEFSLYFYRARYYDPKAGRFVTKDPIGFKGGDVNVYAYVWNNPVNFIDPIGLAGWHFDYDAVGNRLIHYGKYRFNQAGELVEHCGKVINDVPKDAEKTLDWLKKTKPDFFRTAPLLMFPGQEQMLDNLNKGYPLDYMPGTYY